MVDKKFIEQALKAHNEYRARHKVAALKHNKDISIIAQRWADHLASTGSFQHSSDRKFKGDSMGENIAMKWTSGGDDFTGNVQLVDYWFDFDKTEILVLRYDRCIQSHTSMKVTLTIFNQFKD